MILICTLILKYKYARLPHKQLPARRVEFGCGSASASMRAKKQRMSGAQNDVDASQRPQLRPFAIDGPVAQEAHILNTIILISYL